MSAALGAALKKIAVALLTDKRVLKTVGMIVLVLIVALLLPLMAMLAILSGDVELDVGKLQQQITANLSSEERSMLQGIEDTMNAIDTTLTDAGMPSRVVEAQALYIMALYDQSGQTNFVSRLVSCFWEDPTDAQLIAAVNAEFGTNISVDEFSYVAERLRSTGVDNSNAMEPTEVTAPTS